MRSVILINNTYMIPEIRKREHLRQPGMVVVVGMVREGFTENITLKFSC